MTFSDPDSSTKVLNEQNLIIDDRVVIETFFFLKVCFFSKGFDQVEAKLAVPRNDMIPKTKIIFVGGLPANSYRR